MNIVYGCASNNKASFSTSHRSLVGRSSPHSLGAARPAVERERRKSDSVPRLLLTVGEAASVLGIGRSHVYRYVLTGELRSVKIGRSRRIPVSALEEFVQRLQAEQAEEVAL